MSNSHLRVPLCTTVVFGGGNRGPDRLLGQGKFKSLQDMYCGVSILALYFLYLTVVKGALSVLDCSKVGGMLMRIACA